MRKYNVRFWNEDRLGNETDSDNYQFEVPFSLSEDQMNKTLEHPMFDSWKSNYSYYVIWEITEDELAAMKYVRDNMNDFKKMFGEL